jgi:two-component system cell cycle sensor histidine kinase/response regulator CckA
MKRWFKAKAKRGVPSGNPPSPFLASAKNGNPLPGKPLNVVVVVVEDEEVIRQVICERLHGAGYEAFGAASAKDARILLLEHKSTPMILITDLTLPGDGGWSLAHWAWERFPNLPVVFMSGSIDEFAVRSALGHRHAAFLQKPFSLDALVESLRSLNAA